MKAATGSTAVITSTQKTISRRWLDYMLAAPFGLLVLAFLLAPLLWVIVHAFQNDTGQWSLANVKSVFTNAFYAQSITLSLKISLYSSVIGLIVGFQGAISLYAIRHTKLGKWLIPINSLLSNFTGVPLAFAMMIVLGNAGVLNLLVQHFGMTTLLDIYSYAGMMLTYIYFQIPLAILLLYPAIESVKAEWQESAYLLGAGFGRYFWLIVLPVLMPALLGTLVILFANALGAYATAYALTSGSFNILPIRIAALIAGNISLEPNMAATLALVLVLLMLMATAIHQFLLKKYQA
ncbi:ABC transporter permease subunit [Snodgrassella sp. CFCC 13594]|uniref:ABC transporter permease n=1 Tax=Snodgrassella sp. CFCC 13594 TaxID=1775559 RepID=UPI00083422C7|nr:ABC transporter permease subunit [Snodgrassella sp. CFCC 13594]